MKENKPQIYLILQMLCLIYSQDLIGLGKWIFIAFSMDNITQHTSKDTIKKIARALNISPIRLEGGKQC